MIQPHGMANRRARTGRRITIGMCLATIAATVVSVSSSPSAYADDNDDLSAAVATVRGTACGPLRHNPVAEQAAAAINESTDKWINHESVAPPESFDAMPLLKDLGYGGTKSAILAGASESSGKSIKGLLIQGYRTIPDCSYSDFGTSVLYNAKKNLVLTAVVLAA